MWGQKCLFGVDFSQSFSWASRSPLKPLLVPWTLVVGPVGVLCCCSFEPDFPLRGFLVIRPALVSSGLQETGLFYSATVN